MDYSVFDSFLVRDTWHTSHPLDDKAFFQCLRKVVEQDNFDPESMGSYIRDKKNITSREHPFNGRIDDLVSKAWSVRDYLAATM